ncbi:DNA primase [Candidatus Uhrbacteria bacterium]|nr:DNA primase [Candidatus Uhrbacteria bacterium]
MDAPEEIKSRLDIVDLIQEYLPLKPAGSGAFKAVCPFHQEKTPSFYISRTRQTWHCFGCDQGGDHFTFVEKMEGMDFREVLELLAQKTGVILPEFDKGKSSERKRLQEVCAFAAKFFQTTLNTSPTAEIARAYLKKRGVDDLTADLFKLGYAPNEWSALTDALIKQGVNADELLRAGLVSPKQGGGVYDRFRGRLMFPIADIHGNIVGFTARILVDDKNEAKYINTPETSIYKKSNVIYGLDKAKGEIRQKDLAVIVEGNMDVIASHQFGVNHVIATSGTALTFEQLALLKRFTTRLAIAFDQDAAGHAATLRGLDLARQQDFSIRIITLPPEAGKDPDEAVRKDLTLWTQAISSSISIMEWIYRQAFRRPDANQPEQKKLIARDVVAEIKRIADPVERDHWLKKLAGDLGVGEEAVRELLSGYKNQDPRTKIQGITSKSEQNLKPNAQTITPSQELERQALACLIAQPTLFSSKDQWLLQEDFTDLELGGLYVYLKEGYHNRKEFDITPVTPGYTLFQTLAFVAERELEGMSALEIEREYTHLVERLRQGRRVRERERLKQEMKLAEEAHDDARIQQLLEAFKRLT